MLRVEQIDGGMGSATDQDLAKAEAGAIKGHPWLTHMSNNQHRHIQLVLWNLEPPERLLQGPSDVEPEAQGC